MNSENPYRPPSASIRRAPAADDVGSPLKDTRTLALATTVLIALFCVVVAARVFLDVDHETANLLTIVFAAFYLAAGICHFVWAYRTAANAWKMEPRAGISPAWSVWSFIIPVVSLVAPVMALGRVTRVTFRMNPDRSNSPLLAVWWLSFLCMNIFIKVEPDSPVGPISAVISAVAISVLMHRISARQAEFRWENSVQMARPVAMPASSPSAAANAVVPKPRRPTGVTVIQDSRLR